MSLINTVLKDLEGSRKKDGQNAQNNIPQGLASGSGGKKYVKRFFSFVLILGLLALLGFGIHFFWVKEPFTKALKIAQPKQNSAVAIQVKTLSKDTIKNAEQQSIEPVITIVSLQNVGITTEAQTTVISFGFTQDIHYSIAHTDQQTELLLTLRDTKLAEDISPSVKGSSVQSIAFKTEDKNVLVTIHLLPETTVEKLGFVQQEGLHTLQLVLHNPKLAVATTVPEKKEVALTPAEQAQSKFQQAVDLINAGDSYTAMNLLGEALHLSPSDRSIRKTYAALLIKNGYVSRAKLVLSEALMQDPTYAPYISMQAHIYASQGLTTRALQLLQSNSPSMKDYPDYYSLMAALYQKKGQYMSAAQIYDQLTQLQSDNSMWWVGLGVALESAGKHNAAIEAYQRALAGKPLSPQIQAFVKGQLD